MGITRRAAADPSAHADSDEESRTCVQPAAADAAAMFGSEFAAAPTFGSECKDVSGRRGARGQLGDSSAAVIT